MGKRIHGGLRARDGQTSDMDAIDPLRLHGLPHSVLECSKDEVFCQEGDAADKIFLVREGLCLRFRYHNEGRRQIIDLSFPGDFVGLDALVQQQSLGSASALTPTELIVYPAAEFIERSCSDPDLCQLLIERMAREHAILTKRLVDIAHSDASQRIASFLLELRGRAMVSSRYAPLVSEVPRSPLVGPDGHFTFNLPQAVFADALGLSIVHVSRILGRLKREGIIADTASGLSLPNVARLKDLAVWGGIPPWLD